MGFPRESVARVAKKMKKRREDALNVQNLNRYGKIQAPKHVFEHAGQNANHFEQTLVLI